MDLSDRGDQTHHYGSELQSYETRLDKHYKDDADPVFKY